MDALGNLSKLNGDQGSELLRFQPSPRVKAVKGQRTKRRVLQVVTVMITVLSSVYVLILSTSFSTTLPSWAGGPAPGTSLSTSARTDHLYAEKDIHHVQVNLSESPLPSGQPRFTPLTRLPYSVVETFYSTGKVKSSVPPGEPLDIVYLYVNSSSSYFTEALNELAQTEGKTSITHSGRWRENGELKGAIRSAVANIDNLGVVHLLTGVYPANGSHWAQTPGWLDVDKLSKLEKFKWHTHAEIFSRPPMERASLSTFAEDSRREAIPNFSIFAIEGRFERMQGLSENVILSNDDMFFMNALRTTDFHSSLYGPVLRLDPQAKLSVSAEAQRQYKVTQWTALQNANRLLSARFPSRPRNYQHHVPKTLTRAGLDESAVIWADEIAQSAVSGFPGPEDVDMPWLATWLGIERWREALLWSWTVAKMGDWGYDERMALLALLGITEAPGQVAVVFFRERATLLAISEVMEAANLSQPLQTAYTFSSMDGHIEPPRHSTYQPKSCKIDIDRCFGSAFADASVPISANDLFKRLTFEHADCGDCLIKALISDSGPRGLEAFLPGPFKVLVRPVEPEGSRTEPLLPLSRDWRSTNFSIKNVVRKGQDSWPGETTSSDGSVNLRRWCIKLLTRYAYVTGDSPLRFDQLRSWQQTDVVLEKVSKEDRGLAMLCLNDNTSVHQAAMVKKRIEAWIERLWPAPGPWERL